MHGSGNQFGSTIGPPHLAAPTQYLKKRRKNALDRRSTHVDRNVDAEIAVVCEQVSNVRVKDEAIAAADCRLNSIVDASRDRFPRQSPFAATQFQPLPGNEKDVQVNIR